ncbi:hypothetical protein [Bradyrhizobium sp. B117]|uniref:hypothetical protein n=1 Tax=Bradyrhizobium sp. B117 TaxID=3140246 RepID=UPI003183EE7D
MLPPGLLEIGLRFGDGILAPGAVPLERDLLLAPLGLAPTLLLLELSRSFVSGLVVDLP